MTGPELTFDELPGDELAEYIGVLQHRYAAQMVEFGGMSAAAAAAKAAADSVKLFPGGRLSSGHEIVVAHDAAGRAVGSVWLALRVADGGESADAGESANGAGGTAFVFDVVVDERFRGRGHGRALMSWAVARSRSAGARQLQLNVFGGNAVARALYTDLGFTESAVTMSLSL